MEVAGDVTGTVNPAGVHAPAHIGERLKGSLLKGGFDKRMRIDLPVALPVPTLPNLTPNPL